MRIAEILGQGDYRTRERVAKPIPSDNETSRLSAASLPTIQIPSLTRQPRHARKGGAATRGILANKLHLIGSRLSGVSTASLPTTWICRRSRDSQELTNNLNIITFIGFSCGLSLGRFSLGKTGFRRKQPQPPFLMFSYNEMPHNFRACTSAMAARRLSNQRRKRPLDGVSVVS